MNQRARMPSENGFPSLAERRRPQGARAIVEPVERAEHQLAPPPRAPPGVGWLPDFDFSAVFAKFRCVLSGALFGLSLHVQCDQDGFVFRRNVANQIKATLERSAAWRIGNEMGEPDQFHRRWQREAYSSTRCSAFRLALK